MQQKTRHDKSLTGFDLIVWLVCFDSYLGGWSKTDLRVTDYRCDFFMNAQKTGFRV